MFNIVCIMLICNMYYVIHDVLNNSKILFYLWNIGLNDELWLYINVFHFHVAINCYFITSTFVIKALLTRRNSLLIWNWIINKFNEGHRFFFMLLRLIVKLMRFICNFNMNKKHLLCIEIEFEILNGSEYT